MSMLRLWLQFSLSYQMHLAAAESFASLIFLLQPSLLTHDCPMESRNVHSSFEYKVFCVVCYDLKKTECTTCS